MGYLDAREWDLKRKLIMIHNIGYRFGNRG